MARAEYLKRYLTPDQPTVNKRTTLEKPLNDWNAKKFSFQLRQGMTEEEHAAAA